LSTEDLNKTAPRVMVVLDPVKLVILIPETKEESLDAENNQEDQRVLENYLSLVNYI
jgi:glutaminyl-tRNA synthetase